MLIVALTGGIGSGKSTVTDLLAAHKIPVIDTDGIARDILSNNADVKQKIIEKLGDKISLPNAEIDRAKLRTLIFEHEDSRKILQSILHPIIHQQTMQALKQIELSSVPYCIIVIPLLVESALTYPQHRILLIDSPESLQTERAVARDKTSVEQIKKIIATQASRAQRQAIADDIILNDKGLASLQQEVEKLHKRYCSFSQNGSNSSHL